MVDEKFTKLVQDILGPEAYATRKDNIYTGNEYFKICSPHGSISIMLDNDGKHIRYQMHPIYTGVLDTSVTKSSDLQFVIFQAVMQFAAVIKSGSELLSTDDIELYEVQRIESEDGNDKRTVI